MWWEFAWHGGRFYPISTIRDRTVPVLAWLLPLLWLEPVFLLFQQLIELMNQLIERLWVFLDFDPLTQPVDHFFLFWGHLSCFWNGEAGGTIQPDGGID
jgi:hypothetical protein